MPSLSARIIYVVFIFHPYRQNDFSHESAQIPTAFAKRETCALLRNAGNDTQIKNFKINGPNDIISKLYFWYERPYLVFELIMWFGMS